MLFRGRSGIFRDSEVITISDLWETGNYVEVAAITEKVLEKNPLDRNALLYSGFSHFYLAIARLSAEERSADLDRAIARLRLLKAVGDTDNPAQVDYVLGKAYLFKGMYWADLAIRYLRTSFDSGYESEDILEFIGMAYSMLNDVENALLWYELAAEKHPTDRLLITLGNESFKLGRYESAAEYYKRSIDTTKDEELRSKGLLYLGQLYYDVGNFIMAEETFERLADTGLDNQDYQFDLGEIYRQLGISN